jgi:hypothetical protein
MREVKILVSIASADWSYVPGQVVQMPAEQAATWIGSGLAAGVEPQPKPEQAPAPAKPGKKR